MSGLSRRILHGCAALLALAISAFGSPRLSPERISAPERVMVSMTLVDQVLVAACDQTPAVVAPAPSRYLAPQGGVVANALRLAPPCGAGGPRAPCAT